MTFRRRVAVVIAGVAALGLTSQGGIIAAAAAPVPPVVSHLLANSLVDPLGVSGEAPRLSWQLDAPRRGVTQQRYEVHVASSAGRVAEPDVWDSGVVRSDRSVDVQYGGPALAAYTRYFWAVRVWDDAGTASAWSPMATFETGPLGPSDWTGDWIGADTRWARSGPTTRRSWTSP